MGINGGYRFLGIFMVVLIWLRFGRKCLFFYFVRIGGWDLLGWTFCFCGFLVVSFK